MGQIHFFFSGILLRGFGKPISPLNRLQSKKIDEPHRGFFIVESIIFLSKTCKVSTLFPRRKNKVVNKMVWKDIPQNLWQSSTPFQ